ncbi:MAG TPA: hypothetical protein VIU39_11270, partial [Anaerolineales bacterium]
MLSALLELLPLLAWSVIWAGAGILITALVFRLPARERTLTGLALGLVLESWLSNLLAHVLPPVAAFWGGPILLLVFALAAGWPLKTAKLRDALSISIPQLAGLLFLLWVFFAINRGLNLLDDFQNLPLVSRMAAGDIPPHFPFDPAVEFGYHYQLLLIGSQLARIGHLFPWTAFDLARAASIVLCFFLAYVLTWRMTRSAGIGLLGGIFALLASGARWLFLLLPPAAVRLISSRIELIGSARQIAPDLYSALTLPWNVDGSGPVPFPFAFLNGFINPNTLALSGSGALPLAVILLLVLLYRRHRGWRTGAVMVGLLASLGFIAEYEYAALIPAFALAWLVHCLLRRSFAWPKSLSTWAGLLAASGLIVAAQGGVLTQLAQGLLLRASGNAAEAAFHTFSFSLAWPPSLISAHLGALRVTDPAQFMALLFELGPLLLALPVTVVWGLKMARTGRWLEAALVGWVVPGAMTGIIQYSGTAGISANSRLVGLFLLPPLIYAVPLGWAWTKRRSRQWRSAAALMLAVTTFGGLMILGIELIAAQRPLLPPWVSELDARISRLYWDRLPAGAMVFDKSPIRSVIVFGRPVDSSLNWFAYKPEWASLAADPDPLAVRAAGYDFAYFEMRDWEDMTPALHSAWQAGCVKTVQRVDGVRGATDFRKDYRLLLDISACR